MGRAVQFEIVGDSTRGVGAVKALEDALDRVSKHQGFANLSEMAKNLSAVTGAMTALRQGATAASRAFTSMSSEIKGIGARSREVSLALKAQTADVHKTVNALQKQTTEMRSVQSAARGAASATASLRTGVQATVVTSQRLQATLATSSITLRSMAVQAAALANRLAYGARSATLQARSGMAGIAQGAQGLGIGFRMSGLAIGNQLANMGGAGLTGLLGGVAGAAAAGAELGVRLLAGLSGILVRSAGTLANLLLVPLGSVVQGVAGLVKSTLTGLIGSTASLVTQALGNLVSGVTNLVGELVSQAGNIFTGVAEAARGAFQGALTMASQMLGGIVGVASSVAERVAGIFGTIGKAALGIVGTLGGFAFHDFMQSETALKKGIVLLDDKLSPQDERALRSWFDDLRSRLPTLSVDALGTTFQRVVSTGFGGDIEGAKRLTEQAATLAFASGEGDPAEGARVMAKAWSVFRDELEKFDDPFQRISDLMFNVVKVGDVAMGDLVNHLGEVLAPAKAVGLSFENLLTLIAKMSRTAGVEQTFTGLRRLILEPLKMSDKAQDLLKEKGIQVYDLSSDEKRQIAVKQKALSKAEAEVAALERAKNEAPEAARRARSDERLERLRLSRLLRSKHTKAGREEVQAQIDAFNVKSAEYKPKEDYDERLKAAKENVKALKGELKGLEGTLGSVTKDLPGFLKMIGERLNSREIEKVFPDIRAITAMFTLANQDPRVVADIEKQMASLEHVVAKAAAQRADSIEVRLSRLWQGMKAPFKATLEEMRGPLASFLDSAVAGLKNFTTWWKAALVHPALGSLLDNLGGKVRGLFGGLFDGISAPTQGAVWRSIADGLNTVWDVGSKVVVAVKTIASGIYDIASNSALVKSAWDGIKSVGAWVGETGKQLGAGDTSNIRELYSKISGSVVGAARAAGDLFRPIVTYAAGLFDKIVATGRQVWEGIKDGAAAFGRAAMILLPVLVGKASPGGLAGALAGGALGGFPGASLGLGLGSLLGASRNGRVRFGGGGLIGAGSADGAGLGGARAQAAMAALAATAGGSTGFGGPGVLKRIPLWGGAQPYPVMEPGTLRRYSNAERKLFGIPNKSEFFPPGSSLSGDNGLPYLYPSAPPVFGGFRPTGTTLIHKPNPYNRLVGRPDLMGADSDYLFGNRRMLLTPDEARSFMARPQRGMTTQMSAEEASAYFNSPTFAANRGGGDVPMSDADRLSRRGRFRRWLDSPVRGINGMGVGMGLGMAGAALAINPETAGLGSILGGTGTGMMLGSYAGGTLGGPPGAAIGAAVGGLTGFITSLFQVASASKAARDGLNELVTSKSIERGLSAADSGDSARSGLGALDVIRSLQRDRERNVPMFSGAFPEADKTYITFLNRMDDKIRDTALAGLGEAFASLAKGNLSTAGVGDFQKLFAVANGIKGKGGQTVGQEFLGARGMTESGLYNMIAAWTASIAASGAKADAKAAADARAKEASDEVGRAFASLNEVIASAQDVLGGFLAGDLSVVGSNSKYATALEDAGGRIDDALGGLVSAIGALPESSRAAADGMSSAAVKALEFVGALNEAAGDARKMASAAPSAQALVGMIPGLAQIFGGPMAGPSPVASPAADAADAIDDLAESANSAAASLANAASAAASGGAANHLYPARADMTPGEARAARKAARHAAHRNRLIANSPVDAFGNRIDPFTGLPTVGEEGGIGFGARMGDGDMGFSGRRNAFPMKKPLTAVPGMPLPGINTAPLPSGASPQDPSKAAADASGKLVKPAKDTANNLGKVASNLGDVKNSMEQTNEKSTVLAKETGRFVESAKQKLSDFGDALEGLRSQIRAFEAMPDTPGN